jgi:hypothetical protein
LLKKLILVRWRDPRVLILAYLIRAFPNYLVYLLIVPLNLKRIRDRGLVGGSIPHNLKFV